MLTRVQLTTVGADGRAIDGGRSAAALLERPQHNITLCRPDFLDLLLTAMRIFSIAILALVPVWSISSQAPGSTRSELIARRDSVSRLLRAIEDSIANLSTTPRVPTDTSLFGLTVGDAPRASRFPYARDVTVRRGELLPVLGMELDAGGQVGVWIVRLTDGKLYYINDQDIAFDAWTRVFEHFNSQPRTAPLRVLGVRPTSPNSANGVEVEVAFANRDTRRAIKYIHFTVTPYNAVGDVVSSEIGRETTQRLEVTGPIGPSSGVEIRRWDPVWYNATIRCVVLNRVDVEYVDGGRYTYLRELPTILSSVMTNSCAMAR